MTKSLKAALNNEIARIAEEHLQRGDPVMAKLIALHGPCDLPQRPSRPFQTLAASIISQQLSAKAAETIEARVKKLIGGQLTPPRLLSVNLNSLRSAGLSQAKARYLIELSQRVATGELNFKKVQSMVEEDAVAALTDLPGVGQWTAEMFLIFGMRRPNVLALGDAGLKRAARLLYGSDNLEMHAQNWHPYCSVASWYLWRHLDA